MLLIMSKLVFLRMMFTLRINRWTNKTFRSLRLHEQKKTLITTMEFGAIRWVSIEQWSAKGKDWLISHFRFPRTIFRDLSHVLPGPIWCWPQTWGHSERAGPPIRTEPADTEPSCGSHVGRIWPNVNRVHHILIYTAVGQANMKKQFEARAGFLKVIRAVGCTHVARKAPSQEEFM